MIDALKSATWKVFGASMLAGQIVLPVLMGLQGRPPLAPDQIGLVLLLGLGVGAWIFFGAWTWRRLARTRNGDGRLVYRLGVLGWGIPVWITMTVQNAADDAGGYGNALSRAFAGALLEHALITFPFALWGGYFFGWMMTAAFGLPRQGRDPASPGTGETLTPSN